jgi:hypothetical protein
MITNREDHTYFKNIDASLFECYKSLSFQFIDQGDLMSIIKTFLSVCLLITALSSSNALADLPPFCAYNGQSCQESYQCCSGTCQNGQCEDQYNSCVSLGNSCGYGSECCEGSCHNGYCVNKVNSCLENYEYCQKDSQCCSGTCNSGICETSFDNCVPNHQPYGSCY